MCGQIAFFFYILTIMDVSPKRQTFCNRTLTKICVGRHKSTLSTWHAVSVLGTLLLFPCHHTAIVKGCMGSSVSWSPQETMSFLLACLLLTLSSVQEAPRTQLLSDWGCLVPCLPRLEILKATCNISSVSPWEDVGSDFNRRDTQQGNWARHKDWKNDREGKMEEG